MGNLDCLGGNCEEPPEGRAARGWDGQGLKARPPVRRLWQIVLGEARARAAVVGMGTSND